jgi:hypothetical protein
LDERGDVIKVVFGQQFQAQHRTADGMPWLDSSALCAPFSSSAA